MISEVIFAAFAWVLLSTSTLYYQKPKIAEIVIPTARMPQQTFALYMKPTCSMVNEPFQPMPLPTPHTVTLRCPFTEKNKPRKLSHCTAITTGYACWTKKIPKDIKVICPDCSYGLIYHHSFDPVDFQGIFRNTFPIINQNQCNHRNVRNTPQAYKPLPKLNLKTLKKQYPHIKPRIHAFKKPHR